MGGWTGRTHVIGQAVLFTVVGTATTLANAVLYVVLRATFTAEISNVLSVLLTTIASSLVHRWFVFADRDEHTVRMHLQSLAVFLFYCFSNQLALWLLGSAVEDPSSTAEAAAVTAMALVGGTSRFLALRIWVFAQRRTTSPTLPTQRTTDRPPPSAARSRSCSEPGAHSSGRWASMAAASSGVGAVPPRWAGSHQRSSSSAGWSG